MAFKRFKSNELHERGLRARDAFRRIKRAWADWTEEIGPCFMDAKQAAFHLADTNDVKNPAYSKAMSQILRVYELEALPETTRADLIYVMENLDDVQEWRTKHQEDNFVELNNPSTVRRAYDKHLRDEAAAKIKADKEAKKAAAQSVPPVESETNGEEPDDNPYVAARDEATEGEEKTNAELLEVASAELKQKEAEIERLSTFRTEHDEFTPSTPFAEQLKLRVLGLTVLMTDDSLFPTLTERKKKQREAVIKQLGELQRALLILLEPEAVRAEGTR